MTNKPKNIGTAAETAVVKALRRLGFPDAERRVLSGSLDRGDILVWRDPRGFLRDVIAEVKGGDAARFASDGQVGEWLDETDKEVRNAGAGFGFLVVQRKGVGAANAHRWWAITTLDQISDNTARVPVRMTLEDMAQLLKEWY